MFAIENVATMRLSAVNGRRSSICTSRCVFPVMMMGEQVKMHVLSLWTRLRAFTIFRWLLAQKERIRTPKCLSYDLCLQGKAQEKIKSAEDRLRQIEQKMEADKLCHSEAIGKELAKVHQHHHRHHHSSHSQLVACISLQVFKLVLR